MDGSYLCEKNIFLFYTKWSVEFDWPAWLLLGIIVNDDQ